MTTAAAKRTTRMPDHWKCTDCGALNAIDLDDCARCEQNRLNATNHATWQAWHADLSGSHDLANVDLEMLRDAYYERKEPPTVAAARLGLPALVIGTKRPKAGTTAAIPGTIDGIPETQAAAAAKEKAATRTVGVETIDLDLKLVDVSKFNPRQTFNQEALESLGKSLARRQIEPIAVRRLDRGRYELLWGERRLRAARLVGLKSLRAEIHECNGQEAIFLRGEENERREQLDAIEQAIWYQQLIDTGLTQQQVAEMVGCEQAKISTAVGMLKLPADWQKRIIAREITPTHAKALLAWKERPTVLAAVAKALDEWKKPKYGDPRTGTIPSREFERMVEDAVVKCTRSLSKGRVHESGGCHFTVTKQLREQLDVVTVKMPWGGAPQPRAFNVSLWARLNKEAKAAAKKKAGDSKPAPARQTFPTHEGPYAYQIDRTLNESLGAMVAARLKKSDRELTLRLLFIGCERGISLVAPGAEKHQRLDDREIWDWLAPLNKGQLESAAFEVAKAALVDGGIEAMALLPIATELGFDIKAEWKATAADLEIFPLRSLQKMPAAKRSGYAGSDKAELIAAMVDCWTPGELPKEFEKALKEPAS
ncbi:Chromosome-partitioning protein Spo0J [Caulifigura coniformis]|uniref:Chromosome-partitioning protein Spo0J n=1 Tax=Caulifigura coniformis TaxID=2527983 RepID=A0A517SER9_9PLAN|nr:ParB/RepB/Spo0J family partition protein [Caulifigura coniformis]QDT54621.1 Chromosome-partitioning protein Spo0J [Caulifigura coniformis]